jgi:cell division protein FtsB
MRFKHEETNKTTMRIILIVFFAAVVYLTFFDHFSVVKVVSTKLETHRLEKEVNRLNKENEDLAKKNESLKSDYDEVERIAREDHGYRKKNESEIRFVNKKELK